MLKISGTDGDTLLDALPTVDTLLIYDLILTGATIPANCAAAATGTLLASFTNMVTMTFIASPPLIR
jgi:hypothetical protein